MRFPLLALAPILPTLALAPLGCSQSSASVTVPSFQDITAAPAPIQKAAAAIVRIRTVGEVATGSFVSGTGLLLTNNHVLGTEICPVEGCYAQLTSNYQRGETPQAAVSVFVVPVAVSVGLDMALVQVYGGPGGAKMETPSFLTVASHDAASLMKTHVSIVGHPEGHLKKWTAGEVIDADGDWIWTTAYILPGNSGSPILNDAGQLVGIVHRGPTGEDYFSQNGALTYSIGTPSSLLAAAMKAPLPPEMVSVLAPTTAAAVVASDLVYLNAGVSTAPLSAGGTLDVLSALGTACDAALAVQNYPTPESLSAALVPCGDAIGWIECRADAQAKTLGAECPSASDVVLWQQRFAAANSAWVALNGEAWLDPVSFGLAALSTSQSAGISAGAAGLNSALASAGRPLDLSVANYLAAFGVPSYKGVSTATYVAGYASVPGYALQAGDAASAATWLIGDALMTRDQGLGVVESLYTDPSVDVGDRLYIEDIEYEAEVIK